MRTLTLVKHSLPRIDPAQPPSRWGLSDLGRRLCTPLAEHLASVPRPVLYASREPKAVQTAELVGSRLGLAVRTMDGLHEHRRDTMGLLSRSDFVDRVKAAFARPDELVAGEETAHQAQVRFCSAIDAILADDTSANPIVVSHGTVISLLLGCRSTLEPFAIWSRLGLPSFVRVGVPGFEVLGIQSRIPG